MQKTGETRSFLAYSTPSQQAPITERRPTSKLSFYLSLALCFVLLTASWRVSRSIMGFDPWPHHHNREWKFRYENRSISPAYGISVTHRRQGLSSFVTHEGQVRVEGTDKDEISVIIDFKTTSKVLAESVDVSVLNENDIIITTNEANSEGHNRVELDVTVQIPYSTPFVKLSFIYSKIFISDTLNSKIGDFDISTQAGPIVSEALYLFTNSTTIATSAGAVTGHFTLGHGLYLSTEAGAIDVQVDVDTTIESPKAILETRTSAGSNHVILYPPLKHRNQIKSKHTTQAGSVIVGYPQEWEGVVEASTSAGLVNLVGKGLRIVESRGKFADRYEKGVKGEDYENKGTVDLFTAAGKVGFELGPGKHF